MVDNRFPRTRNTADFSDHPIWQPWHTPMADAPRPTILHLDVGSDPDYDVGSDPDYDGTSVPTILHACTPPPSLRDVTLADIAAELRRRAEWHDGTVELTADDSIAEALRAYNPRWAGVLLRMARRLEAQE